jgi:hypothetical protein
MLPVLRSVAFAFPRPSVPNTVLPAETSENIQKLNVKLHYGQRYQAVSKAPVIFNNGLQPEILCTLLTPFYFTHNLDD